MNHRASPDFRACYRALPASTQRVADRAFVLLEDNPRHPSLHFQKVAGFRSVRVGLHHRAVGIEVADGILRFWIGTHAGYDRTVS